MRAQPGANDDPERAFGPHEQLREVGADRRPRCATRVHERAFGEYDVEALDDVFDLAVAGGELAGPAAREPAADRRERDRLWPMPTRDFELIAKRVLEHVAEHAGAHVDQH